jgi:hypothetical protein
MTRYAISADAACAHVEDGAVLLHMRTKRYYSLNETGAAIWQLLEEDVPVPEIGARLVEWYDIDRRAADEAVAALLTALSAEALISVEGR